MVSSHTDAPVGVSLFIEVWVNAKSKDKARVLAGRVAERGQVPSEAFEIAGFDGARKLWKLSGIVELPSSAAEEALTALRIVGRLAKSISVSSPRLFDGGHWSLDGHAVEADLHVPGTSFLAFSARSVPAAV